ncbi:RNA polymerase sigma factor [Humisphaera borealis]|uniref:RNA polymerase sigma factor n=1 Tax=Humisphaera borealis TaxID=2807512 RepID=A0A7M2X3R1_9BACT|nr:RNA polymerase sigma factor [Humisphaera borealis]QOV91651.1 RNA polymerase sigma factor [Humisphaera borealis]
MDRPAQLQFRDLVLAELPAVHRLAVYLCRSREIAEDLVQETYLRVFKSAGTYRETDLGPRPWLFKILHNVWRTRAGRRTEVAAAADELAEQTAAPQSVPLELDWENVDQRVKKAVEQLPDNYRDVLLLWAVEEMKYREIADITGIPIGTVMSRLFRARQLLAESLADVAVERGL